MNEDRKRRYPTDREKLHALADRLEKEIAERQEKLAEVKRLIVHANNMLIVNAAKTYNVTPEEFVRLAQALRSNAPSPEIDPKEVNRIRKPAEDEDDTEETEDD